MVKRFKYIGLGMRAFSAIVDIITCAILTMLLELIFTFSAITSGEEVRRGGIRVPTLENLEKESSMYIMIFYVTCLFFCYFWSQLQATPGMMLISAKIVDARTGNNISILQSIIRYITYVPSWIMLGFGIFSIAMDDKKQGWHDKSAGTVIVQDN